ncbi:hypothetical protein Tco_1292378 [Tanacetum coccineum]
MIVQAGEGSENQLEPHHTPSTQYVSPPHPTHTSSPHEIQSTPPEAQTTPQASLPHTTNIPSHTPTPRRMKKGQTDLFRDLANVLSSMEAANILASRGSKEVFTTNSSQVPPVSSNVSTTIVTTSEKDPTAKPIRGKRRNDDRTREALQKLSSRTNEFYNWQRIQEEFFMKSNVMINKHMAEYEEAENDLTIEEKTELITELIN